jgi:hypothetical protein
MGRSQTKGEEHMSEELKIDYGTCWPDEYDWETQFAEALNGAYGFVTVDAGKLRGVALAYKELRESKRPVFVGLTDDEIASLVENEDWYNDQKSFVMAVEKRIKEKNT